MLVSASLQSRTSFLRCLAAIAALSVTAISNLAAKDMAYKPVINVKPEVFLADGTTVRTYNTVDGVMVWRVGLPVLHGDKVKLNVFALTGGAEVGQGKIRLDNAKIADLKALPWITTIDTANLANGYHMVEAWVETAGKHPQSSTAVYTFMVASEMPTQYVTGTQAPDGTHITPAADPEAASDAMPDPPAFIKGQPQNDNASVMVRSTVSDVDAALIRGAASIDIGQPTVFYVDAKPGSAATKYGYVLSRGGKAIAAAPEAIRVHMSRVRIQGRTDSAPGLRPGPVTLWVWGIDKDGHPSAPVKVQLLVLEGAH